MNRELKLALSYLRRYWLQYLLGILALFIVDRVNAGVPLLTGELIDGLTNRAETGFGLESIRAIALRLLGMGAVITLGRFGYSTSSDLFTRKVLIYVFIFASSAAVCFLGTTLAPFLLILALCVVNAGYGGGFSTLPIILRERFGMEKISMIHGFALSAWAWAGLSGNQLSSYIINSMGKGYGFLLTVLGCLYLVSLVISLTLLQKKKAENA